MVPPKPRPKGINCQGVAKPLAVPTEDLYGSDGGMFRPASSTEVAKIMLRLCHVNSGLRQFASLMQLLWFLACLLTFTIFLLFGEDTCQA